MAESEGFEPPIPFRVRRFSRPMPSTTRPALRSANADDWNQFTVSGVIGMRRRGGFAHEGSMSPQAGEDLRGLDRDDLEAGLWDRGCMTGLMMDSRGL